MFVMPVEGLRLDPLLELYELEDTAGIKTSRLAQR
jgi:hypothetical protein